MVSPSKNFPMNKVVPNLQKHSRVRLGLASSIMCALLANSDTAKEIFAQIGKDKMTTTDFYDIISQRAIMAADILIKNLKE